MTHPRPACRFTKDADYAVERFVTAPVGNNAVFFGERKKAGSDCILRIPPMITGTIDDVCLDPNPHHVCYEQYDRGRVIASGGLESLVYIPCEIWLHHKDIYILDNHDHAFHARDRSGADGYHLIHVDQHSDLSPLASGYAPLVKGGAKGDQHERRSLRPAGTSLSKGGYGHYIYMDIGSFILPALSCGMLTSQQQIRTEYALMHYDITTLDIYMPWSCILDIDIDFWAPEMRIEHIYATYRRIQQLIAHPAIRIITIATSPTYIDQRLAVEIIKQILPDNLPK